MAARSTPDWQDAAHDTLSEVDVQHIVAVSRQHQGPVAVWQERLKEEPVLLDTHAGVHVPGSSRGNPGPGFDAVDAITGDERKARPRLRWPRSSP